MFATKTTATKPSPLYQEVADRITGLIDNGTFRTGDRLPSIRQLSVQLQVSINTVKMAYCLLEDRMVIEAKPQSGFYVKPRLPQLPQEPDAADSPLLPSEITSSTLVMQIMQDALDQQKVQFGAAIPAEDLVPAQKLHRLLTTVTRRHASECAGYAMPPGNRRLRNQIARRMIKAGCTLNPGEILITTGAAEAVYLALRTLCQPGDTVAVGAPLYFNFVQMFYSMGLRVLEIPSSPTTGIQLDPLQTALEKGQVDACLVISNFNNPLGTTLDDSKKAALVTLLADFGIPLIEDDINGDLAFSNDRPSVAKAWDRDGGVVLCSSFSKTIAPGYRIGWIAPGRFFNQLLHQKMVTNIATPTPTQLAVAEFLENGGYDHHLRTVNRAYSERVAQMAEAIGDTFPRGTRVSRPQGGFTLWVELPQPVDTIRLYTRAIAENITVAPGTVFSTTTGFAHCLRLNAACWSETNRWAVQRLGELTHHLMDHTI